jgi:hypothetical protein
MKIRFLAIARQELDDAVEWYDRQSAGLGLRFLDELDRVVRRIKVYPNSCQELAPGLRRALLSRFPYESIHSRRLVAVQPLIAGLPADAKTPARLAHVGVSLTCNHYELNSGMLQPANHPGHTNQSIKYLTLDVGDV